jgi:hypothetical protein
MLTTLLNSGASSSSDFSTLVKFLDNNKVHCEDETLAPVFFKLYQHFEIYKAVLAHKNLSFSNTFAYKILKNNCARNIEEELSLPPEKVFTLKEHQYNRKETLKLFMSNVAIRLGVHEYLKKYFISLYKTMSLNELLIDFYLSNHIQLAAIIEYFKDNVDNLKNDLASVKTVKCMEAYLYLTSMTPLELLECDLSPEAKRWALTKI